MIEEVSVIIVTFNRPKDIKDTVESLLNQSVKPLEIIVIDDGSNPPIELGFQGENFRIVRFETEVGLSNARNYGVSIAKGKYIAFIDDDGIAEKNWIKEIQVGIQQADIIGGLIKPLYSTFPPEWWNEKDFGQCVGVGNVWANDKIWGCNMVFRAEVFKTIGAFNPNLGRQKGKLLSGEETDLINRAKSRGFNVHFVPAAIVFHKVSPKRMTISYIARWNYYLGRRQKNQEGILPLKKSFDILFKMFSIIIGPRQIVNKQDSIRSGKSASTHTIKALVGVTWLLGRLF